MVSYGVQTGVHIDWLDKRGLHWNTIWVENIVVTVTHSAEFFFGVYCVQRMSHVLARKVF